MEFRNYESISARAIVPITLSQARTLFSSSAVATNELKAQTSIGHATTGKTGRIKRKDIATMKSEKHSRDRSYDEAVVETFQSDPDVAVELLNSILEDGDNGEFLIALRQLTKAFGGVAAVAEKANLNQTQLYRTLSEEGNPALSSLAAILKAIGFRLAIERTTSKTA
jgi:probable addiction module antidote protein